jgi:hypothetical protein
MKHNILMHFLAPTCGMIEVEAETPQKALTIAQRSLRKHGLLSPLTRTTDNWKTEIYMSPATLIQCRLWQPKT